ncbi:MAG TPA: mycofactocin biosynthesis chaperone MftB, partial [Acidimicrobiales bacterium]|nr:mycofactocin biosynthesis chaperone MftB [Acidimicrobiales bacterium]
MASPIRYRAEQDEAVRPESFGVMAYHYGTRRLAFVRRRHGARPLSEHMRAGLDAPICLTWELTYGCNLACTHCLSSSGRSDPRELTTPQARRVIDDLAGMQVFYVNVGGGEPTIRADFFDLITYAVERGVGVKFSTNGTRIDPARAAALAGMDYVDVQISV